MAGSGEEVDVAVAQDNHWVHDWMAWFLATNLNRFRLNFSLTLLFSFIQELFLEWAQARWCWLQLKMVGCLYHSWGKITILNQQESLNPRWDPVRAHIGFPTLSKHIQELLTGFRAPMFVSRSSSWKVIPSLPPIVVNFFTKVKRGKGIKTRLESCCRETLSSLKISQQS